MKQARKLPKKTSEEKAVRADAIRNAKQAINDAREFNAAVERAAFVMHELTRFDNEFGKKQLELCRKIVSGGENGFYKNSAEILALAEALPETNVKEERVWRKQEIRNAKALAKSARLVKKYYPDGVIDFDPQSVEDAYNLPDDDAKKAKIRRAAMKDASRRQNMYATVAAPYLTAKRTVALAEGYKDIDTIISDYDRIVCERNEKLEAERLEEEKLELERKTDRERYEAQKKLKSRK
ncbi:MAG: cyclodeaminase/cyclohydrolase family protein [Clostridia bacterium]|nr:cyclodeaminase/cyclohydrolase family protein [Clostridia bacterium]